MKLSSALLAVFDVQAWEQPKYSEVLSAWSSRTNVDWGHPLVGGARKWSDCPSIDISGKTGVAGLRCNMATCALKCEPGNIAVGRRRAKCRFNRKKKTWFWKNDLGSCRTCDPAIPQPDDVNITTTCKVNINTNRRFCKLQCPSDHTLGTSKSSFVKIACKCPRTNKRDCGWYNGKRLANYKNYSCTPKPTPPSEQEPTAAPTQAPTNAPTQAPTEAPTQAPTQAPTNAPTQAPTEAPTQAPTQAPTNAPTQAPTEAPTQAPTQAPTEAPTQAPTNAPTQAPTEAPTQAPTTQANACQAAISTNPNKVAICTAIDRINALRAAHSASALQVDSTLCDHADAYALKMGPGGSISHDGAELGSFGEGENLYAGWAGSAQGPGTRFSNAIDAWYAENQFWNYGDGTCQTNQVCGHFTQQVWLSTTHVCYGYHIGDDGWEYVVARYSPPGNFFGQYTTNVIAP